MKDETVVPEAVGPEAVGPEAVVPEAVGPEAVGPEASKKLKFVLFAITAEEEKGGMPDFNGNIEFNGCSDHLILWERKRSSNSSLNGYIKLPDGDKKIKFIIEQKRDEAAIDYDPDKPYISGRVLCDLFNGNFAAWRNKYENKKITGDCFYLSGNIQIS